MSRPDLRVYFGPDDDSSDSPDPTQEGFQHPPRELVEVTLEDVVSVLSDAVHTGRVWLQDFGDERVMISRDLFDILRAYQYIRRSAA
jgi:hypothetical protein